ncbi:translation initiation factor eIF-2B subunit alpha [Marasmius tenuissimus]|uniref:Translation initiation factor eIF2B subunit alpha n=1 Tax=Marasmius tenuissimus TaxID=585030 RepID=A0ABR3ADG9_9AGAR|nr:translation initiation factor eIF-2B subunit alpha [Marasmius tenuissimus]
MDIYETYLGFLKDEEVSPPLAAILALTEIMERSNAGTTFELVEELKDGAEALNKQSKNPISLNAGCKLFIEFITLFPHASAKFSDIRTELIQQGRQYVAEALTYRQKIAEVAFDFIKDDSVILTHSYSRVVMQTLLMAHKRKRISVYVTEARPKGLGIRTAEMLTAAGIPCTVVLDSAVAYAIEKVDFVLVGSEAVVESGGLINAVGSNQLAIIARAASKPFYALAESFKFHRLFPLSQDDLPIHNPSLFSFPISQPKAAPPMNARPSVFLPSSGETSTDDAESPIRFTQEQIAQNNPEVDYTRPDLITLVFSDVGSLTPEGVSQYLVGMFTG